MLSYGSLFFNFQNCISRLNGNKMIKVFSGLLSLFFTPPATGQHGANSVLSISYQYFPPKEISTNNGNYSLKYGQLNGQFLVYSSKKETDTGNRLRILQNFVNLGLTSSGAYGEYRAFSDRIGLRYLSFRNPKNSWIISGNVLSILQRNTDPVRYFPTARIQYIRTTSPSFSYFLGGGYNFIFGNGLPTPLVGFRWKPEKTMRLTLIFPGFAQFAMQHSRALTSKIVWQPTINLSLTSATDIPGETRNIIVRSRAFKMGYQAQWTGKTGITFQIEAGWLFRRRLQFTDQVFSQSALSGSGNLKIKNGGYFECQLSILLGKKDRLAKKEEGEQWEIEDEDISNGVW